MKFQFKIQQYQTDAVNAIVKVFAGQSSSFVNDSVATNFDQIFTAYSPTTTRKVI